MFILYFLGVGHSDIGTFPLPFNFLSVLVVRGGAVCLPTPPSWFIPGYLTTLNNLIYSFSKHLLSTYCVPDSMVGVEIHREEILCPENVESDREISNYNNGWVVLSY